MTPCRAIHNLYPPVRRAGRVALVPLVLVWLCASLLPPCAAQNPPLSVAIANHQPSLTVPFLPSLVSSGWIPVEVRINGKGPYMFVLDTGAYGSFLRREVADVLKLPTVGKGQIVTGSRAEAAVEIRTAVALQLGTATLHNLTLYALDPPPDFPADGILGADFLAQFVVTVDYERQRVTLTLPDRFTYKGGGDLLPFTLDAEGTPFIAGSIEGIPGNFEVDTGSNGGLDLSRPFVLAHDLRDKYPRHVRYQGGVELAGTPDREWDARDDTLLLGKSLAVHDVIVSLTKHAYSLDGVIGSEVLRQFTLTVDWPHKQFYLEKNGLYGQKTVFNRVGFIPTTTPDGFKIVLVMANSPASEADVRVGDRLVEIAGQPAQTWTLLKLRDLTRGEPGTKLSLTLERDGKRLPVVLTLRELL